MHKFSPHDAFKNYLLEGNSISVFEAMVLFAVQSPRGDILRLKREGFLIGKRRIPMVQVLARLNKIAVCIPPKNLPVKEILITEYWIKKWTGISQKSKGYIQEYYLVIFVRNVPKFWPAIFMLIISTHIH